MKESLEIKNVGPLKDVYIDDIKPLTVFIGESACGKSTLMKVLIFMRYVYKMLNIRWYLKNSGIQRSPFKLSLDALLHDELRMYLMRDKNAYVKYTVSVEGRDYSIEFKNKKLDVASIHDIPNGDLVFFKESWVSESRNVIPVWSSKSAANSSYKKAELGFYFHETLYDFEKATDALDNINLDYLGMKMTVSRQGGKKKYYVVPNDGSYDKIELKYASSGVQTSASLVTLVNYFSKSFSFKDAGKRSILGYLYEQDRLSSYRPEIEISDMKRFVHIHVEEPELSLFPAAQCQMIDDIVKCAIEEKAMDRQIHILLATHSPYIINYLNVLLYQNKDNRAKVSEDKLAVYRIYEGKLQNLMTRNMRGEAIVDTSDLTEQMRSIMQEYKALKQ